MDGVHSHQERERDDMNLHGWKDAYHEHLARTGCLDERETGWEEALYAIETAWEAWETCDRDHCTFGSRGMVPPEYMWSEREAEVRCANADTTARIAHELRQWTEANAPITPYRRPPVARLRRY